MKWKYLFVILLSAYLVSCSEYQKLLQSTDYNLKWEKAQSFYEEQKYTKVVELLEELVAVHKGTDRAEKTYFLLAYSYFNKKDYYSSAGYFETVYKTYPRSEYSEESRFMAAKSAYFNSPDPRLTQEETVRAMDMLNVFIDYFPDSKFNDDANKMVVDLREKLAYKQLLASKLYFDLGNYMGNNYQSCIVTANNALIDFPDSKYREELSFLILKSKYTLATESIDALKVDRYRAAIDEYYSFKNDYPESTYKKEAENMLKECRKIIKD